MDAQFIQNRISQLQRGKHISERRMSLELGHSPGYLRSITSGRALPSMSEFLYICEYLGITPEEFFHEDQPDTSLKQQAVERIYSMSEKDVELLLQLMDRLV